MGSPSTDQHANAAWKKLLESYDDPGLDPDVESELQAYMAEKKKDPAAYLDD
jgi:trimethylamine---corrinoid protein Co-methyltransferase